MRLSVVSRSVVLIFALIFGGFALSAQEQPFDQAILWQKTPLYLPFNSNIPSWDRVSVNEHQKKRNLAFEEWISAVQIAAKVYGFDLAYKVEKSEDNPDFVQPNYARIKLVGIAEKWEGAFTHLHMDLWFPAQAAIVAIANARWSLLFDTP